KSRFPKRMACALRQRNSLRVAIQIWGGARPCYRFRDCGRPHSAQREQSGGTASLISPSQHSQIYLPSSAQTEQSGGTVSPNSPSQRSQSCRPPSPPPTPNLRTTLLTFPP